MTQARARYAPLIIPFALVLIVLVAWTGWWFWLSQQVRDRLDLAAEGLRAQGWAVVYSEPTLSGWPFRTRLESEHVRLTAPTGHEIAAPRLIAVGGLSGTGKSTLAKRAAMRLGGAAGAIHLRTDIIRKRMFGIGPLERLPDEAYAPGVGEKVYAEMMRLAGQALDAGMSVVADAVFAREEERRAMDELAAACGVACEGLWLDAPPDVLKARVAAREKKDDDPSDADVEVVKRQLGYNLGKMSWRKVDASGTPEEALVGAMAVLEPR